MHFLGKENILLDMRKYENIVIAYVYCCNFAIK